MRFLITLLTTFTIPFAALAADVGDVWELLCYEELTADAAIIECDLDEAITGQFRVNFHIPDSEVGSSSEYRLVAKSVSGGGASDVRSAVCTGQSCTSYDGQFVLDDTHGGRGVHGECEGQEDGYGVVLNCVSGRIANTSGSGGVYDADDYANIGASNKGPNATVGVWELAELGEFELYGSDAGNLWVGTYLEIWVLATPAAGGGSATNTDGLQIYLGVLVLLGTALLIKV